MKSLSVRVASQGPDLGLENVHRCSWNASSLQVWVELCWCYSWVELVEWRSVCLLEARIFLVLPGHALNESSEVESGEDTVVGDYVILPVGLEVVQMLEAGGV